MRTISIQVTRFFSFKSLPLQDHKITTTLSGIPLVEIDFEVYPNPFRHDVYFEIVPKENTKLKLEIISVTGQLIEVLYDDEAFAARKYEFIFNSRKYPDNMFIYRITTNQGLASGRVFKVR